MIVNPSANLAAARAPLMTAVHPFLAGGPYQAIPFLCFTNGSPDRFSQTTLLLTPQGRLSIGIIWRNPETGSYHRDFASFSLNPLCLFFAALLFLAMEQALQALMYPPITHPDWIYCGAQML